LHYGRVKISLFLIWLVTSLFSSIAMVSMPPIARGKPETVLAVSPPTIIDVTETPGTTFSINITVADVSAMWGYQFYLYYDTTVLTATNYATYPPFNTPWPSEINDDPTVTGEKVGTGDGVKKDFNLAHFPVQSGSVTVYFDVKNETLGSGDDSSTVFYVDHIPVKTGTVKVYLGVWNETVGVGDGVTKDFYLDHFPVQNYPEMAKYSETICVDGVKQKRAIDYTIDYNTGKITFINVPSSGTITARYFYVTTDYVVDYDAGKITFTTAPALDVPITVDYMYFTTDYVVDYGAGKIMFTAAPESGLGIFADYKFSAYVFVAYSMKLGEPVGFSTVDPKPIARIDFSVDALGATLLDIRDSIISDILGGSITHDAVDGLFANQNHDITVTSVTSPKLVTIPESTFIGVMVKNNGAFSETFSVTAYYDDNPIETKTDVSLTAGNETTLLFTWSTAGLNPGTYTIKAVASTVPGETDTDDNTLVDGSVTLTLRHDVAVVSVVPSPTTVMAIQPVSINVTVQNQGNFTETFNVITYYDNTQIDTKTVTNLENGTSTSLIFTWNTAGVWAGTYTIKAWASPVTNETDTADNTLVDGNVTVTARVHDIKISDVTASPTSVAPGQPVSINVTLTNIGGYDETVPKVEVRAIGAAQAAKEGLLVASEINITLLFQESKTLTFTWNTTSVSPDIYQIRAVANAVPEETYITDNKMDDGKVGVAGHDLAVTKVEASPTLVMQGESVSITVTVFNKGTSNETFDVTVKYDNTTIQTKTVTDLQNGTATTVNFTWDTTGVALSSYNITAVASTLPGETAVTDNTKTWDRRVTVGRHNVAITNIIVSPVKVAVGGSVTINVTVRNLGNWAESFNVTVKYGDTNIATQSVSSLGQGANKTLTFKWVTAGVPEGTYAIKAVADSVTGESDITDNTKIGDTVLLGRHDIAVTGVTVSSSEVSVGQSVSISVTVQNQGNFTETFSVTVKFDDTEIGALNVTDLASGASATLDFSWDTASVSPGTYTIKAVAGTLSGETDTDDNTKIGSSVKINAAFPILLYALAGVGIVIVAAIIVYMLKFRKPKPPPTAPSGEPSSESTR